MKKAMEWARLGADKGEVNSIYLLGDCYWREKNIAEASVWFEKAAEKGLRAAQLQTEDFIAMEHRESKRI